MATIEEINSRYYRETIRVRPRTEVRITDSIVEAKSTKRTQLMVLAAVKWGRGDYRLYKTEKDYEAFKRLHSYKEEEEVVKELTPDDLRVPLRDDERTHREFTRVIDYLDERFLSFDIVHQVAEVDPFPKSPAVSVPFSVRVARAFGRPVRRKVNEYLITIDFPKTHRRKRIAELEKMLAGVVVVPPTKEKKEGDESSLRQSSHPETSEVTKRMDSSSSSTSSGESSSLLEKSALGSGSPRRSSPGSSPKNTLTSVSEDDDAGSAGESTTEKSPVIIGFRLPRRKVSKRPSFESKPVLKISK